jgi:ACR3 family arsenite efflux pump ArsB
MSQIAWMVGISLAAWLAATAVAPEPVNPELLLGMVAPLVSAVASWAAIARTHRRGPERVTGVLVAGFGIKLVLFGVYLALMLRVVGLRPVPFAVAFTSYCIGLYLIEALFLKRLFADGLRPSPGA